MNNKIPNKKGFSLVELIIAIGAFVLLAGGVFSTIIGNYKNFYGVGDKQAVAEFAQEGIEAVRAIRDRSWQVIEDKVNSNTGLIKDSNNLWQFNGSSNTEGELTRVILISEVSRDDDGLIVSSGGDNDISTKLLTVTITGSGMDNYVLEEFLTNWDYKIWEQDDWSGGEEATFWYDSTKYSSSTNMTATSSGITLTYTDGIGYDDWVDLDSDAYVNLSGYGYDIAFSMDHSLAYVIGDTSQDLRSYDISDAVNGNITADAYLNVSDNSSYSMVVHPTLPVAYIGHTFRTLPLGYKSISVIGLTRLAVTSTIDDAIAINDLVIGKVGGVNYLFALTTTGYIYIYSINAGDGRLTYDSNFQVNSGSINNGYFDETNEKLYVVTDDDREEFVCLDASRVGQSRETLTQAYSYDGSADFVDIKLYDSVSGNPRFLIATEDGRKEFLTIETTSACRPALLDDLDLHGINTKAKSVIYDGDSMALVYDGDGKIYSIDVSDPDDLAAGSLNDTTSYGSVSNTPYSSMHYSTTTGGIFILQETSTLPSYKRINFIKRPIKNGSYASSGSLTSSIFDLGSSKKELHTITTTQTIPAGCSITVTLETNNNYNFSSPNTREVYTLTGIEYTSIIDDSLHGKRWARYVVDMRSCNSSSETPTFESLKLKYE